MAPASKTQPQLQLSKLHPEAQVRNYCSEQLGRTQLRGTGLNYETPTHRTARACRAQGHTGHSALPAHDSPAPSGVWLPQPKHGQKHCQSQNPRIKANLIPLPPTGRDTCYWTRLLCMPLCLCAGASLDEQLPAQGPPARGPDVTHKPPLSSEHKGLQLEQQALQFISKLIVTGFGPSYSFTCALVSNSQSSPAC